MSGQATQNAPQLGYGFSPMQLLHGGQLFLSGVKLASPRLRRYIWVPALIGVVIFSLTLAFIVAPLGGDAGQWLQQNLPEWLGWLKRIAGIDLHHSGAGWLLAQ